MKLEAEVLDSNGYARLLWWEVINFMAIEHGRCEFDERNMINFKGYNDSGKSAMIRGLSVLLYNAHPTQQTKFIMDDREYFRILAKFEDGVLILRDKYINGQSLYEMYAGDELVYSSKTDSGVLTRITEVPKPIADYLGLVMFDDICLNSRACFEKKIGVETSGSENYNLFHTVLKAEELARASTLLNTDKNILLADITNTEAQLQSNKELLGRNKDLTRDMIDYLYNHDSLLDGIIFQEGKISDVRGYLGMVSSIQIQPELGLLDSEQVDLISSIFNSIRVLQGLPIYPYLERVESERLKRVEDISRGFEQVVDIKIVPELDQIELNRLDLINKIFTIRGVLSSYSLEPELCSIDTVQVDMVMKILDLWGLLRLQDGVMGEVDKEIDGLKIELESLEEEARRSGEKMIRCPSCGVLFCTENTDHEHIGSDFSKSIRV